MSFSRLWTYVSGWNPFKSQDVSQTTGAGSAHGSAPGSAPGSARRPNETNEQTLDRLEAQHKQNLSSLLGVVYNELTSQFQPDRQYTGDVVNILIHQTIQRLAQEVTPDAQTFVIPEPKEKDIVAARVTLTDRDIPRQQSEGGLTDEDIRKSMQAFDQEFNFGGGGGGAGNQSIDQEDPLNLVHEEVEEEVLVSQTANKTGFSGNPYYSQELDRAAISDVKTPGDEKHLHGPQEHGPQGHGPQGHGPPGDGPQDVDRAIVTDGQPRQLDFLEDDDSSFAADLNEIVKDTQSHDKQVTEEKDNKI